MSLRWQISFGQLFEVLRPAAVALAVACSTWVLADARRRGLRPYACAAWTLATLVLPFTALPLYLLARLWRRTTEKTTDANESAIDAGASAARVSRARAFRSRHAPTLVYALTVTALAALYFVYDYRSLDAHLARASDAKLNTQHARAAAEYRAALRLGDDPHTRKLLGLELAALGRWPEALAELRAAERGGEPDAALPLHLAKVLAALERREEAAAEYRRFLASELCTQPLPDARCARARLESK
ncbi:MAG TPA: hypothetical protein VF546_18525 [Pyrinomonadaceae bacterium]